MHSFYDYMPYGNQQMNYLKSFQTGGQPKEQDYPDYESWAQAMDEWVASQGISNNANASQQFVGPIDPFVGPKVPAAQQQFSGTFKLNPYKGVSVVDFLGAQGFKDTSYKSRKKLAALLGIDNYRGSEDQNALMMQLIQNNPDVISGDVDSAYIPSSGASATTRAARNANEQIDPAAVQAYYAQQAADNPYVMAPTSQAAVPGMGINSFPSYSSSGAPGVSASDWMLPAAAVTAGSAGALYAGAQSAKKAADFAGKYSKASRSTKDIAAMAQKMGRAPETYAELISKGMSPAEANKALKGAKFKSKLSPEIIEATKAIDINKFAEAAKIAEQNEKQAAVLVQMMKDQGMVRDPKLMAKLEQLVPNTAKRMSMLSGIKMGAPTASTATTAAKAAKAAGLGTRLAESIKGIGKSSEFLKALGEGYKAVKGLIPREEGGPVGYYKPGGQWGGTYMGNSDYIPNYEMAYGGIPEAMYGMGMAREGRTFNPGPGTYNPGMNTYFAEGGQMPQWLAQRRFAAAGNEDKMSQYGYAQGGEYGIGDEIDVTPEELEMLKQQGYKIQMV